MRFKNTNADNYYMADTIIDFYEWSCKNPHSLAGCNGSYTLWIKCKDVKNIDGFIYKYGDKEYYNMINLKKKMQKLGKSIEKWKEQNKGIIM